jgi:phosphinothricin acetyltransferase
MLIRPATENDLPAINDIYNWAVVNTTASAEYEPNPLEMRHDWFAHHQHENLAVFVAEDESYGVIGWSALSLYRPRYGYRFTVEDSIYIHRDHWGKKVGGALLLPLVEAARARGSHSIMAVINGESESSVKLHARLGFIQVGYWKEVIYKFDRWLDIVQMQLML